MATCENDGHIFGHNHRCIFCKVERTAEWDRRQLSNEMQNRRGEFAKELESLINRYCQENESDTPDFILAGFLRDCLTAWNEGTRTRERWYGRACGNGAAIASNHQPTPVASHKGD